MKSDKTNASKIQASQTICDKQVADYLSANPNFFVDRQQLLLSLSLPHQQSGAVSLVEKQVSLLRERNLASKKKLSEFIKTAEQNDAIFSKCQKLILDLIEADSSNDFFAALEKSFKRDFKCKAYSLIVFNEKPQQINHFATAVSESAAKEYVGGLMKNKEPTLGVLRPSEQDFLFRHQSSLVKSAAIISVKKDKQQLALLAIGSHDPLYFKSGMGTVFIGFIADILSRMLPKQIDLK